MRPAFLFPRRRAGQAALAAGIAVASSVGLAMAQTVPAKADPTQTLVAVGSDTIQDVYNQFGVDAGGNLLGSYNAVNPVTQAAHEIITPANGTATVNCSFVRPNGSGEGVANLRLSLDPTSANGGSAVQPAAGKGCVDIARSSSGPGNLASTTGPIVYIPFATDAVAGATGGTAAGSAYSYTYTGATDSSQHTVNVTPVATAITQADLFTQTDLTNLYKCSPVTEGGVTYDPTGTVSGDTKIDLYVPQAGSGTRNFWASTLGFSPTSLPSCVHDTIVGGPLANATGGVPVEEHNGTPMTSDPNGFGPFSIAQWISQRNGHSDRRHGAVVHSLNAVSPFSNGNSATGGLNTSFPITRSVYSVVSYARVTNTSDPLYNLLNGSNSFLCNERSTIVGYGFGILSTCGQVVASLRAAG